MSAPIERPPRPDRSLYRWFKTVETRWEDNDLFGHVNNAVYYSYYDTAINRWLIDVGGFDPFTSPCLDFTVESGCRYHRSVAYPDILDVGIRVGRLGTSSVRWEMALFRIGEDEAAADGHFVHVFVDRTTQRPVAIPAELRRRLASITVD
jgi:acyl-CoA thioester hydrolase